MSSKGIYDDWKYRKNFEKYGRQRIRESTQLRISDNIKREQKKDNSGVNFNKENFENGKLWFNEGFSLDECPDKFKSDASFIAGYNKAQREKYVNDLSYKTGIEYYENGVALEDIPQIYIQNKYFMNGYNSGKNKKLSK